MRWELRGVYEGDVDDELDGVLEKLGVMIQNTEEKEEKGKW